MKSTDIIGTIASYVIKIGILVLAIYIIYNGAFKAYDFGYAIFADTPMSEGEGRTVSVVIQEDMDTMDISELLETKGLVADKYVFYVQELLSDYKDMIVPGTYELNTSMTSNDILKTMSQSATEEESEQ